MNKIVILSICLLFFGASIVATAALTQPDLLKRPLATSGVFEGLIGYRRGNDTIIVGEICGAYVLRNRGGRFTGEWNTENHTGGLKGMFGRNLLLGRISGMVNDTQRVLPIVGFIGAKEGQFLGRFMAPIGPALYFWGTYN